MVAPLSERRSGARGSPTQLKVLLVEDSEDDARLLLRELRRGGFEPVHERVQTAEAMKKALSSASWDVIVSDYYMPRFDAMEALRVAQEDGDEAPLFIVASGKVGEDVAVETIKAGAYDFVPKDKLGRLCAAIERGLKETEEQRWRRQVEKELRQRDGILDAVRFAAEHLLGEEVGWDESVRAVIRRLGEAAGVSRVYIFENFEGEDGELRNVQRYEWLAPGVTPGVVRDRTDVYSVGLPYRRAGYGRWMESMSRGDPLYGHTREFPEEERSAIEEQNILSIVVVPIFVEGKWWGFVGFDECFEEREWSPAEVGALSAAAGTLGAAIKRRRDEEQLRSSEARYRAVIDQATDGIYILDAETRSLLQTNPSFQKMLGYSAREMDGMKVYDFVAHPREDVEATIERTLRERRRVVGGRKYRRKDGSLVNVEVGVSVISYDGRDVICTIVRDVTERKHAEEALARSENRLRMIIETEPECVKVLGPDGSLLEMNPAGLSMIEADSLEQVRGKSVYEYIAAEHRTAFVALTERVLRGGSGTLEFELVGLKGTHRWLETHAVPLRDAEGESLALLAITRDVTKRKDAEEGLRQSERLYRTVIEQATENIFLVDVETRCIVESNPAFREAMGYSEEDLRGMTLYDVVAADRESVDKNIERTIHQGRALVGDRRYRRRDGTFLDVEASGSVILRNGRQTLCVVAHDITERARIQGLLEQRVAALSRISADLALDLPAEVTLSVLARNAVESSTAVACGVILVGEGAGSLHVFGSYGLPEGYTEGLQEAYRAGASSPSLQAYEARQPVLVRDIRRVLLAESAYAPLYRFLRKVSWDVVYSVPLISRGRALGTIFFLFLPGGEPEEDERIFLRAVADGAAVAVENAQLFSDARGKAALEERQRLARELHDSVSQALYGIVLGAKTARSLVERHPERAVDPLDYVISLADAGLTEMRALIFELRPESLESEGLVAALEKQAAALRARHEIEVEANLCSEPGASPKTKEAIYRIAQEAMHNTVKHARATSVRLVLRCAPDHMSLDISDDGVGFDPGGEFPGHLGLRSMRERALKLGGRLTVVSEPGRGTRIQARLPIS